MRIIGAGVVAVLISVLLFFFRPAPVVNLDHKVCDLLTGWAGPGRQSGRIVIVEVDDKSLTQYGRWPWPRDLIGRLVERIASHGAAEIVLDMMFPQEGTDMGGPADEGPGAVNDRLLAGAIQAEPSVVGYSLLFEGGQQVSSTCGVPSLPLVVANAGDSGRGAFLRASGALCNVAFISRAAAGSGFLNAAPDSDGKTRRMPLVIESGGRFYPSLALAAFNVYRRASTAELIAEAYGASRLRLGFRVIPLEGPSLMRLRFRGARRTFRSISAADVLSDGVPDAALRGRIALLGGTAQGLWNQVVTPVDALFPGVEIQATAIDDLIQGDVFARPTNGVAWELSLALAVGLGATVLLERVHSLWGPASVLALAVATWAGCALLLRASGLLLSPLPATAALACSFPVVILLTDLREKGTIRRAHQQLVSARELTREALELSESRYRRLVENVSEAITVDDRDGRLIFANRRFWELFGRDAGNVREVMLEQYVAPESRAEVRDRHDRVVRGEIVPGNFEFEGITADGKRLWIEAIVAAVEENGFITGTQAALRDITERKRMEAQYLQAQKMESVGRLAGGVAHDFNNLLQVINGYSDMVMEELSPDHPCFSNLVQIRTAGERAAELTQKLLTFGRKDVAQPQVVELNLVVAEAERMFGRLIGEDIELVTRLDPTVGHVMADPGQLCQVMMNLVVNSRDSMPGGGRIVIETKNVTVAVGGTEGDSHPGLAAGSYAYLGVTDTGTGMSDDVKQRLFEPFFTTKDPGKGTGLGLATVYAIVKQTGGSIWVTSQLGEGTAFHVYLPQVKENMLTPPSGSALAPELRGSETVLLVEDQDAVRQLASALLENYGYHVLQASNGPKAIELASQYRGAIHLLLTDVVLPFMNGRVLADDLRRTRPEMKVLYVSGYAEDSVRGGGAPDGGRSILAKPFSREALAARVREVLADRGAPQR
jgi:PAS domain S-box-containing protein